MYTFVWRHKEEDKESLIQIPMKITKVTSSGYGIHGKLVCEKCSNPLKQTYKCDCGWEGKISDIKHRLDEENKVVYLYSEKKKYISSEIDSNINVVNELPLDEVFKNFEFFETFYEIYNNKSDVPSKVYQWLTKNQTGLLVMFGYREKNRTGIVIPAKDRLMLVELRDGRLIKDPKQEGINPSKSKIKSLLDTLTESEEPDAYFTYIELLKQGKKVEIKAEEQKEEVLVDTTFLDG